MCQCCRSVAGRLPRRAEFRWWTHKGRHCTVLCGPCVGWWLLLALEDDDLMPVRVESLEAARSDGGA